MKFIIKSKKWFGIYRKLWLLTNSLVWKEGKRLSSKYGTHMFRPRRGSK